VTECGDGVCDGDETETNCPQDCGVTECGDGVCDGDETETNCPQDCGVTECGDGVCGDDENPYTCPQDCEVLTCGNGVCEAGEETSCLQDCTAPHCGNGVCESHENPATCPSDCEEHHKVDVLFMIDNSPTMQNEQAALQAAFPMFYTVLENRLERIPDLHIGVITPDLGIGSYTTVLYCQTVGGDGGRLGIAAGADLADTCLGPEQHYMVDIEPQVCTINRDANGQCAADDCEQSDCDAMEMGSEALTLTTDGNGCPRCRNFSGAPDAAFSCISDVGVEGCGFEQPLEAMKQSLDMNVVPANNGFLRPDALLAVVLVTDEDDCSASEPNVIFNPDPDLNTIDSSLGFLNSFRCFEFGVSCDVNDRTVVGLRNDCAPRDDAAALLFHPDRYANFLASLVEPGRVVVSVIGGPVPAQIDVQFDQLDHPMVQPSCIDSSDESAKPGVRLEHFATSFNTPAELDDWAYASICQNDFQDTLEALGLEIAGRLGQM
jgi:hypothetical protein